jgi:hypothetical protein
MRAMGWTAKELGFDSQQGEEIILFSVASRLLLRSTQCPIQWVLEAFTPQIKQPGCEADHSPPSTAKVKNTWIYTSTTLHIFMGGYFINKAQENSTLSLHLKEENSVF